MRIMDEEIKRLRKAARAYDRAEKRATEARAELHAAIVAALDAGISRATIGRETPYTRQRIQQIDAARRPD